MVLDQEDDDPFGLELADEPKDLGDEERRRAVGGLVQEQEAQVGSSEALGPRPVPRERAFDSLVYRAAA